MFTHMDGTQFALLNSSFRRKEVKDMADKDQGTQKKQDADKSGASKSGQGDAKRQGGGQTGTQRDRDK
jgi:hypothetical protein